MEKIPSNEDIPVVEKTLFAVKDNEKISIKIKIQDNKFLLSAEIKDSLFSKIYEGIISQQEIQKTRYFLQFDTLSQILDELILKSKAEPPQIKEEHETLILKFFLGSTIYKDIEFTLKPKSKSYEDKFTDLYNIVTEIKKENSELKQEIDKLKNKNVKLEEQIQILLNFKNKIEEEKRIEEEKKVKINSIILNDSQEQKNKIKEFISFNKKVRFELIYRMTRDGVDFNTFHRLCDNIAPNLLLIKDYKNNIFGGFTNASWEKKDLHKNDPESFLFSLNKNRKYYPKHKEYETIYCYNNYGPWFWGGDIGFQSTDMSQCISYGTGDYLNESLSSNKAGNYFQVQEVEFFRIIIE